MVMADWADDVEIAPQIGIKIKQNGIWGKKCSAERKRCCFPSLHHKWLVTDLQETTTLISGMVKLYLHGLSSWKMNPKVFIGFPARSSSSAWCDGQRSAQNLQPKGCTRALSASPPAPPQQRLTQCLQRCLITSLRVEPATRQPRYPDWK